ncbi:hypothetical protein AB0M39_39815 [Streptomyces sp. NPDC051907]|uniref:hypothetical protein n=1 Tax=Streptomyces sp. NPDC051907 TaxID=3155284 RepID=UPI00343ED557
MARMLCDKSICAAVAEHYQRDADEEIEAGAALEWAIRQLTDQNVELLRLRDELERATPGKTLPELLNTMLAAHQERGGAPHQVVLVVDEFACLVPEGGLFPGMTIKKTVARIERLIRQGRKPYPFGTAGGEEK